MKYVFLEILINYMLWTAVLIVALLEICQITNFRSNNNDKTASWIKVTSIPNLLFPGAGGRMSPVVIRAWGIQRITLDSDSLPFSAYPC